MKKKRIHYIDQAKAIGILLIVLGHVSYIYGPINNTASYFKISIFYIISGILTRITDEEKSDVGTSSFEIVIVRKIRTLLIPYVFYSVLALIYIFLFAVKDRNFIIFEKSIIYTITFRGISTLWFLPTLFSAFLFHEILHLIKKNQISKNWIIGGLVIFPLINCLLYSKISSFLNSLESDFTYNFLLFIVKSLVAFWFFEIGYSFYKLCLNMPVQLHFLILGGAIILVNILGISNINFNAYILGTYPLMFFIGGVLFSFSIIGLLYNFTDSLKISKPAEDKTEKNLWLEKIGIASLFIMCTHAPLPVLLICSKIVEYWIPRQNVINIVYIIYVAFTFIFVIIVELIGYKIWNWIKKKVINKPIFTIIRYC